MEAEQAELIGRALSRDVDADIDRFIEKRSRESLIAHHEAEASRLGGDAA